MDRYIQTEAKRNFKDWTQEGLSFLLQQEQFREMAITALSKFLKLNQSVEFAYNGFFYELFESADSGYVINVYSSNAKDNLVDGGLCNGSARDSMETIL